MIRSAPGKPPSARRRLPIAKVRPAITGVVVAVEVVAVERQAGLEPQRIARAKPDRLDRSSADQRIGDRLAPRPPEPKSRTRPRRYSPSG